MALIILLNGRIILRCRERNIEGWLFLYMDLAIPVKDIWFASVSGLKLGVKNVNKTRLIVTLSWVNV